MKSKEEPRSQDWAPQVKEEEKDFLRVMEECRRKVATTRELQELEPRTVRTVEALGSERFKVRGSRLNPVP